MIWIQINSIMLVGGLLLLFIGTLEDIVFWQVIGFISFITALLILWRSFKEADY